MASKKTWKQRAKAAGRREMSLRSEVSRLNSDLDYHRSAHGQAAEKLQLATTSPDTKAAHEAGYASGFAAAERGHALPSDLERGIDKAMMPALLAMADAESAGHHAAVLLNTAYAGIQSLLHPSAGQEEDAAETMAP